MFGESVFALIPDHEVRAAKLTNRWISGCWWGRDGSSDEHLVGAKFGVLKCRSVRRKPPGEEWSRRETSEARGRCRILTWKWTLEYLDQLWNHVEMKKCHLQQYIERFQRYLRLDLRQNLTVKSPNREDLECMLKDSGSELSGLKSGERLNVLHARPPGLGKSHTRECKAHLGCLGGVAKPLLRRRRNVELSRNQIHDR